MLKQTPTMQHPNHSMTVLTMIAVSGGYTDSHDSDIQGPDSSWLASLEALALTLDPLSDRM